MKERRPVSMGQRWRRISTQSVDDNRLELALDSLPSIRNPRIRILPGSIRAEMEGVMGSINEVSIHVPRLSTRIWSQVVRVMRRSSSMQESLRVGRVPRSFDRLIARISGESITPEARRVSSACTCGTPDSPCRHVLALHELFARRLDERPWEALTLRGVDLKKLLDESSHDAHSEDLPPLAFGSREEPVLFPEGEESDMDSALSPGQISSLLGRQQIALFEELSAAITSYAEGEREPGENS